MKIITMKLTKNGQNQTVRIPKSFEFTNTDEVVIRRNGNSLIITPKRKSWASFAELGETTDNDFMQKRPAIFRN